MFVATGAKQRRSSKQINYAVPGSPRFGGRAARGAGHELQRRRRPRRGGGLRELPPGWIPRVNEARHLELSNVRWERGRFSALHVRWKRGSYTWIALRTSASVASKVAWSRLSQACRSCR